MEEQFLTRKLADAIGAPAWLVSRVGQGDGLLISADRNPNVRGALVTGLIKTLPDAGAATPSNLETRRPRRVKLTAAVAPPLRRKSVSVA